MIVAAGIGAENPEGRGCCRRGMRSLTEEGPARPSGCQHRTEDLEWIALKPPKKKATPKDGFI